MRLWSGARITFTVAVLVVFPWGLGIASLDKVELRTLEITAPTVPLVA